MRFHQPIPDRIQNAPDLWLGLGLYYRGFLDLTSDRQIGMAVGPIPMSVILEYCARYGIEGEQQEDFIWLVARLDQKYLAWSTKRGKSA